MNEKRISLLYKDSALTQIASRQNVNSEFVNRQILCQY